MHIDPYTIIEKFYRKDSKQYRIFTAHAEAVAKKSVDIATNLDLNRESINFIREAALLHDIGIYLTNAPGIDCFGENPYICHGFLGRELLDSEGLPKHGLVAERHTGTGLTLETIKRQNIPIPHREMMPITIEEQIICYADKFFSKSGDPEREKPISKIISSLHKHGSEGADRFISMHRQFSLNQCTDSSL